MIVASLNEWKEVDKKYRRKIVQECMNNTLVWGLQNYGNDKYRVIIFHGTWRPLLVVYTIYKNS